MDNELTSEQARPVSSKQTAITIAALVALMVVLQALRILLERLSYSFVPLTDFSHRMTTMCIMLLLSAGMIVFARRRKTPLSVFPENFSRGYIIATCVCGVLLMTSPSYFSGGIHAILLAFYGSVVTPIFEELVFRGYIWNRLETVLHKPIWVFAANVLFFTVWHTGYMLPHIASGNWSAVLWKLAAGFGYGAVLGFIRLRTKNCYSTMLAHGVLNMFMI